jgi:heme-degrading monooxygenase HmoA
MKEIPKKNSGNGNKKAIAMVYVLIKHKVKDFEKWKPVFDEHAAIRKTGGSQGGQLFRNVDSPDETIIIFKWDSIENAQKFAASEDLKKAMQRAGVIGEPEIYFLDNVEKVPV